MKRYVPVVIAMAAFLAQSAYARQLRDPVDTPLGKQYRAEIELLTLSPKLLPSSCHLVREVRTAQLFPATTNPFVTDDAALIRFVSLIGFGSDAFRDVSVAISALYYDSQSQHEVGVWALRFKDGVAASRALEVLGTRDVLVRDSMVVTVWRDDDTGRACQSAIEAHVVKNGFAWRSAKR